MTTLKGRLELALSNREGATKAGLARACGVTKPAVSAWFSGAAQAMTGDNLLAAARYLAVRPDWLSSGRGPMLPLGGTSGFTDTTATDSDADSADTVRIASPAGARRLPLIQWAQVGKIGVLPMESLDVSRFMESPFTSSDASFLLELASESMAPDYRPGEVIQVDPLAEPRHGDDVVVLFPSGRTTFRRLVDSEDGRLLQALNPGWPDRLMPYPDETKIVGVVVGSWMSRRK